MRIGFNWHLDLPGLLHLGILASKAEIGGRGVMMHKLEIGRLEG